MKSIKGYIENCNGKKILKKYYGSEKIGKSSRIRINSESRKGSRKNLENSENSD